METAFICVPLTGLEPIAKGNIWIIRMNVHLRRTVIKGNRFQLCGAFFGNIIFF